jgi:hypothetical protein
VGIFFAWYVLEELQVLDVLHVETIPLVLNAGNVVVQDIAIERMCIQNVDGVAK